MKNSSSSPVNHPKNIPIKKEVTRYFVVLKYCSSWENFRRSIYSVFYGAFHVATVAENCERFFFMTITLSMVNTWLSLFSPYFRKFENDVLGYPIWWNFSEIIWLKSRYLRWWKIDFLTAENIIYHIVSNCFQNWNVKPKKKVCVKKKKRNAKPKKKVPRRKSMSSKRGKKWKECTPGRSELSVFGYNVHISQIDVFLSPRFGKLFSWKKFLRNLDTNLCTK